MQWEAKHDHGHARRLAAAPECGRAELSGDLNVPTQMVSKVSRRALFWVLLATALGIFVSTIILSNANSAFYARHSSAFADIIGSAVAMLLVWCAVFISDEQRLVRLFLIIMALLIGVFVALPTL